MTGLLSVEAQERSSQALSTLHRPRRLLSRQSSEVDYEAAQQLIKHSQGRRDDTGGDLSNPTMELSAAAKESTKSHMAEDRDLRRSASQELLLETQYSPFHNPPGTGQVCRYGTCENFSKLIQKGGSITD